MKELEEENKKMIEQEEFRKKEVDSNFKDQLKSLSKSYS